MKEFSQYMRTPMAPDLFLEKVVIGKTQGTLFQSPDTAHE